MSMRINQTFDTSLTDETGAKYKYYANSIESAVSITYFI